MNKSKDDHTLAVIKAIVSAIPYVGGSIASLITDYVPSSTQESIEITMKLLGKKLEVLGDRIDSELINKEEFSEIFKSAYLEIIRTHQEIKREAATGLIANALLRPRDPAKLTFDELDHFSRALESISTGALQLLGIAVGHARKLGKDPLDLNVRLHFRELDDATPDWDVELVMGLVGELHSTNFLHLSTLPTVKTDNYGNYPVEVTGLGARFVDYVLELAS